MCKEEQNTLKMIEHLLQYSLRNQLIEEYDLPYTRNTLLQLFNLKEPLQLHIENEQIKTIDEIIGCLIDYGYKIGLIEHNSVTYRDLLDAKIMGIVMPRPSQFIDKFKQHENNNGIEAATQYFYELSINSRYIRMDRVQQNPSWVQPTKFGNLQITINLAKPEKDPTEIAKLKEIQPSHYPLCLLCKENVGYAGRLNHPARQNLRTLPITLQEEQWHLQYSPYVYYNEHSIVLSGEHKPMKITAHTFARLLDFVKQFPHYFIGSNADLPIVGGSILSHDHYQAGRHSFPMDEAPIIEQFQSQQFPNVKLAIVKWPLSVIRLYSDNAAHIVQAAEHILQHWRQYSDLAANIEAYTVHTSGEIIAHNTITPIARIRQNGCYELDLVLRNNRTSDQHPFGIFHPHEHLHHIKKENIGLIEVMGLAVLPGRLKQELELIAKLLADANEKKIAATSDNEHPLYNHSAWINELFQQHGKVENEEKVKQLLQQEVGNKFLEVLEHAGVYKQNQQGLSAFKQFIHEIRYFKT